MPPRKNKLFAILKRRERVAELYLDGKTVRQIAEQLACSIGSVSADLKAIKEQWMEKAQQSILKLRAEVLAKIGLLENTAWNAFLESKGEQVVSTNRGRTNAKTGAVEVTKQEVRRFSPGDPRFLEVICKCLDAQIRLFGLGQQKSGDNYDHLPVIGIEVVQPTNDEMNEMNEMN